MKQHQDMNFTFPAVGHWFESTKETYKNYTADNFIVQLPQGTVTGYTLLSNTDADEDETTMKFVSGRRIYRRYWNERYSRRYLITLAKRFVRDVSEGKCD